MSRKILYSPGYGAGWTTWNSDNKELQEFLLTYQPIIDFIESGGKFTDPECHVKFGPLGKSLTEEEELSTLHPLLKELYLECKKRWNISIYMGGADDLAVEEVEGRVHIEEYDGYESIVEEGSRVPDNYWL